MQVSTLLVEETLIDTNESRLSSHRLSLKCVESPKQPVWDRIVDAVERAHVSLAFTRRMQVLTLLV
jgi:hypothetical protein